MNDTCSTMKVLATLFFAAAMVVLIHADEAEEGRARWKAIHQECQADPKTHVDDSILEKAFKGEHVEHSVIGAHFLCMSKKIGFVTEEGKPNKTKLKDSLSHVIHDQAKVDAAVIECAVEKDTPEETAIAVHKCFFQHIPRPDHHHH